MDTHKELTWKPPLPSLPGTYALLLRAKCDSLTVVGQLGEFRVCPGWYVYIGSARGPGGLAARVGRHLRPQRTRRWHVDYLRAVTTPEAVWIATTTERLECHWAEVFGQIKGALLPLLGFGSSDCRCRSHLLWLPRRPSVKQFQIRLAKTRETGKSAFRTAVMERIAQPCP